MKLAYNDDKHAYWLDGTRCKGVTSVAKIPDDTYNLDRWKSRQVVLGMTLDSTLIERAAAHHDDRDHMNKIADEAMAAARANDASARGTAIHRIIERHDLGENIIETPLARAARDSWERALKMAGLEVVPEYVERIVVFPDQLIAGRLDRLCRRVKDGKLVVVDLKTGTGAVKYPHSTSIQLGMYAHAPLIAGQLDSWGKTEQFERLSLLNLDRKYGYIVHMPTPEECEVQRIDIGAGFDIAKEAIFPILKWRKVSNLLKSVGTISISDLAAPATQERVSWIRGRLQVITMLDDAEQAKQKVSDWWPEGTPTRATAWTEDDVDKLADMLTSVERAFEAPFSEQDPARKNMRRA